RFVCVKHPEQNIKGEEIVERTNRPDGQHKIANQAYVPALGLVQKTVIDAVGRDGDLGQVVEQIVQQDLGRQHGQEAEEGGSGCHAQHVPKVGAGAHQQVLHDVAEGPSPFDDAGVECAQAVLEQNDVGGIAS